MALCQKCMLPGIYKNNYIHSDGICNYCKTNSLTGKKYEASRKEIHESTNELENALRHATSCRRMYDVAVGFSGGKDSAYLCLKLKRDYGLRVLGIVIDHSFFPKVVVKNIAEISKKLDLDIFHYRISPSFMEKFFGKKFATYRQLSNSVFDVVCGDCSNIIEGSVMKIAAKLEIPVVLLGLSPEQTNRYFFKIPQDHINATWVPAFYEDPIFTDADRSTLWNPKSEAEKQLSVYFPFHVWDYDVEAIIQEFESIGLLTASEAHPISTECKILHTIRYIDRMQLGYDPRIGPFSDLVRMGRASREELQKAFQQSEFDEETLQEVWSRLDLDHKLSSLGGFRN